MGRMTSFCPGDEGDAGKHALEHRRCAAGIWQGVMKQRARNGKKVPVRGGTGATGVDLVPEARPQKTPR